MNPARQAAIRILVSIERGRTTLAEELDEGRQALDDVRDRSLLFELAAGTLRWRGEVDALIAAVSRRPLDDLDPYVRATLRVGAYQLRHLDRVPAHAVVHESVELIRAAGRTRATGFVNGIMRALTRLNPTAVLPQRPPDGAARERQISYLTTTLSHPRWLVDRWLTRYGFEAAEQWCAYDNQIPRVTIFAEPGARQALLAQLPDADVDVTACRFATGGFSVSPGIIGQFPEDLRRTVWTQDEGSWLVAECVPAAAGSRVLDLCAAPGGKSRQIARRVSPSGVLVACDLRPKRIGLLRRTLAPPSGSAPIVRLDATQPLPFGAVFDAVLLDAPCSGVGTIGRDPDVKWIRQEADLAAYAATQTSMLGRAADAVRPGGTLVYSTCSSEPDENQAVVSAFLRSDARFRRVPVALAGAANADLLRTPDGDLATTPPEHGLDAYFAAALVRREGA